MSEEMKTYKTLKELKAALDSGELKLTAERLVLDSDVCFLYVNSSEDDDGVCVFRAHPANLLEAALDLMGIPWENA